MFPANHRRESLESSQLLFHVVDESLGVVALQRMKLAGKDIVQIDSLESDREEGVIVERSQTVRAAPRGKTLQNAIVRLGAQSAAILINLLATPYIIARLGIEAYGIVGLVNAMISFMAIATTSLTATVGRNLTFAIERDEHDNASKVISTAFFGLIRLFAVSFLPLCALAIFLDSLVVIPQDLISASRAFVVLAILSFAFATLSGPLGAAMYARNRLDLLSGTALARTVFFIAAIVVLFGTVGPSLQVYGVCMLASSVLLLLLHKQISSRLLPGVRVARQWYDYSILRSIVSLGGWMTLSQIGGLLILQTDLLIANRVLGPTEAGQLAAVAVIPFQLRVLASLVSGLFGPTLASLAARNHGPVFSKYLLQSIRLTTLFFALLTGVFCGSANEVLSIWLGREFAPLTPVAVVLTAYLVVTLGASPSGNAMLMLGKVKIPAVVTVSAGVVNLIVCMVLANAMGLMGIALTQCIVLLLLNAAFLPWYVSRESRMNPWLYWREQCLGVTCCAIISLTSFGVSSLTRPDSLTVLVGSLILSGTLGTLLLFPLGMPAVRQILLTENRGE